MKQIVLVLASAAVLAACGDAGEFQGQADDPDDIEVAEAEQASSVIDKIKGKFLFEKETFNGNGRTCETCHSGSDGQVSPAEAQARFKKNKKDPLFRPIDSDDGVGTSYTRLLEDATIRVTIPLPAGWSLADDPGATSVTMRRAIPTTNNVPSTDDIFMYDGRNLTLEEQALGAVNAHYQPGKQPTQKELELIADHQQTFSFFSDARIRQYANGGPAPTLPQGITQAQKRGRKWFEQTPGGVCAHCHSGPMLNETNQFLLAPLPPGSRFFTAFVSELNKGGEPVRTFNVTQPDGTVVQVQTPDPGRALITGNLADLNTFRIPTIWGSKDTAPYFHDNSAKNFAEMMQHYSDYFQIVGLPALSAQEQTDISAYLQLL